MLTAENLKTQAADMLTLAKARIASGTSADGLLRHAEELLALAAKGGSFCAACSGRLHPVKKDGTTKTETYTGLFACDRCGGLHGEMYRGEAPTVVNINRMSSRQDTDGGRYFNLALLGSEGVRHVHGWFDPATKLVLQFG